MLRLITILVAMLVGGGSALLATSYELPFWLSFIPGAAMAAGFALGYLRGYASR